MPTYLIEPMQPIFFRDARPMEGGSAGHGDTWPSPRVFHGAFNAAYRQGFPELWVGVPERNKFTHLPNDSLRSAGPFPVWRDQWLFPRPETAVLSSSGSISRLRPLRRSTNNLPSPLEFELGNPSEAQKEKPCLWWSKPAIEAFLKNERVDRSEIFEQSDLYLTEYQVGIGINPTTSTQDGERIYSCEYLRLHDEVAIGVTVTMSSAAEGSNQRNDDGLQKLFSDGGVLAVGGQQRFCRVKEVPIHDLSSILPLSTDLCWNEGSSRIFWLLLTPAIFPEISRAELDDKDSIKPHPGGWLPNWIDPNSGTVLLKRRIPRNGLSRKLWRQRIRNQQSHLDCRLVAACVPKPIVLSGWSEHLRNSSGSSHDLPGALCTVLAVPAGAVYYFEGTDCPTLAKFLSWHGRAKQHVSEIVNRRSGVWGEKGFGIGVCGVWGAN